MNTYEQNQETIRRYSREWKTPITAETTLKVGDIIQMGRESVYKLTSVSKCFVTMEHLNDRSTIFECNGSFVGCVVAVYKIDAKSVDGFTRRKARKYLIEHGFLRTDLDNIYSVYEHDYLA